MVGASSNRSACIPLDLSSGAFLQCLHILKSNSPHLSDGSSPSPTLFSSEKGGTPTGCTAPPAWSQAPKQAGLDASSQGFVFWFFWLCVLYHHTTPPWLLNASCLLAAGT